ncbi:MAG: glycerophosphodiester phosphodiesterase family protein [Balneolaceae bacterium]
MKNPILISMILIFTACSADEVLFDLQGHRGARGLLPENTVPGFLKAVELGVNTIELDLVVTQDREILVSHEPWFNHQVSTHPDGRPVTEEEQLDLNIFKMNLEEVQRYDVGSRGNELFPNQEPLQVAKPALRDAIEAIEKYVEEMQLPAVRYNIEIKSQPEWYDVMVPQPAEFARILYNELQALDITGRVNIQSFDPATLVEFRNLAPDIPQALLVGNDDSMEENLERLGYIPEIYSPHFRLVTPELMDQARENEMLVIPWTVNTVAEMQALLDLGVDGIITDYPDSAAVLR